MNDIENHNQHNDTGIINVSDFENQGTFFKDILIDSSKIQKTDFDLNSKHNFHTSLLKSFTNYFDRKNILYFGTMFGEEPVPIETTQGNVRIPLINKEQLANKIKKTNKPSNLFGYAHISTVQILLKSTFARGIDSPITLDICDNRLIDTNNALISTGKGNLKEGILKFDINVQTSISILDKNIEDSVIIKYELLKTNFMKPGNHPFSVAYKINYTVHEKEVLAIIRTLEKWQIDLKPTRFELRTDSKYAVGFVQNNFSGGRNEGRLVKWQLRLSQFQPYVRYIRSEDNSFADTLTREWSTQWKQ